MKFKWLAMLALLTSTMAQARSQVAISFGPSMNGNASPKYASLGYEYLFGEGSLLAECGGIFGSPFNGICALVLSARVQTTSGLFTRVGAGPAYAAHTDDRLSSNFEFSLQGVVGIAQDGWDIGLKYQHFSNAGIVGPNLGRDFLCAIVEIGI